MFFDELPDALERMSQQPDGQWCVHFHVPLYLNSIGILGTTQNEIRNCLNSIQPDPDWPLHFELETYAWTVIPTDDLEQGLATGIAREFNWFDTLWQNI